MTDDERLSEIRADALSETYGDNLDFGHVGTGDFIEWVHLIQPQYARIKGYENLLIFDINSILRLFEEWTQGKHDEELSKAANPPPGLPQPPKNPVAGILTQMRGIPESS